MPVVQPSDFSPFHKFPEAVEWKHKICVFPRAGLVKIGTPLRDFQPVNIKRDGQLTEGKISPAKYEVERRLAGKMDTCGRNKDKF